MTDKSNQMVMLVLVIFIIMAPSTIAGQPPYDEPAEMVWDLLDECYHQTMGSEVGYEIKLTTEFKHDDVHIVAHSHPYFAAGAFEFLDFDGDYYRYLILSGYTYWANDCGDNHQPKGRLQFL